MIVLIGAGGMAKDLISLTTKSTDIKIYDDFKKGYIRQYKICGTVDDLIKDPPDGQILNCIGSVGDNSARNKVFQKLKDANIKTHSINMGILSANVIMGENILINYGAQIHHDCVIEDNCVIGPGAIICGGVHLCNNCFIGAGAVIKQGVTIGKNAVVGTGSVVLRDVPDGETWVGNPARRINNERVKRTTVEGK